jgi:hypothetical protein
LVNRVTRAFTEASYPTELVLSVGKSGLNQELIERNFKLGHDPDDPAAVDEIELPDVLIEISDAWITNATLGEIRLKQLLALGESNPDKIFLVLFFYNDYRPPSMWQSSRNVWFWLVYVPDFEFFEVEALTRALADIKELQKHTQDQSQERLEKFKEVEGKASTFVTEIQSKLEARVKRDRRLSNSWQLGALIVFGSGIVASGVVEEPFFASKILLDKATIVASQAIEIIAFLKVIGFLSVAAVATKYCAEMSKAFMRESLRNEDRIHAISFGMFYLSAFGNDAEWQEIKDAFKEWNINQPNAFADIKGDFNPRIVDIVGDLVKQIPKKG